ncbi:MAG: LysR family transcriptional regulator [Hungatella sp.]|nr:LysR family transcriptional regulator [Hungatella sp.]
MDIRMYEYPLAIAREGSFSRAAASLGISQSALSHSLSALERDLGVALFDRSTRYLKPTGSGRIFLEAAGQIAAVKQQTYQAIHMLGKPHSRELVIGMTPYNGARIYSYLFKEFYSLYPDIRLIQREGYMNSLKEAMRKKEIHLLIGTSSDYSEAGCRFVRFARQEVLLAVAKTHPLAARASAPYGKTVSVSLKEMEDIPFLIPGPETVVSQIVMRALDHQRVSPTVIFRSNNMFAIREMCTSGLGIGCLPSAHVYSGAGLRYFSLEPKLWNYVGMLYHNEHQLSREERHLIYLCYCQTKERRRNPHFFMDPNPAAQAIIQEFEPCQTGGVL